MAQSETKTFMKYFFFLFVFIIAFCLLDTRKIEIFGLVLFFVVNFIFCIFMGKDLTDGSIIQFKDGTEQYIKYGILLVSLVFSFVSSIMMMMTIFTLQGKFAQTHADIKWSQTDRKNLDTAKILFITVTTFIGVVALYVYNSANDVRKFTYSIFDAILNSYGADWLRVIFPIVIIGLGSALYGRLEMDPLIVNKTPKEVICDPKNNEQLKEFKDSFIKSYWFLFAFVAIVLLRPFIEANFDVFGIFSTGTLAGFTPGERTYVFGNNPSISLISILTLGMSYAFGLNDYLKRQSEKEDSSLVKNIILLFASFILLILILFGIMVFVSWLLMFFLSNNVKWTNLIKMSISVAVVIATIIGIGLFTAANRKSIISILLTPIIRWDTMYSIFKSSFGLLGLVFASFTIKHFSNIPEDNACLFKDAHIRQLYLAFIVFLIIFYTFNTLSASTITTLITNIMRYLVPPSLLGMSSYLIFTSNNFMKLAPKIIVQ